MQLDTGQLIQFQSKIHRIIVYVGVFTCDDLGGLASGETARLQFDLKVNDSIIHTFYIDYDENQESDLSSDFLLADEISSGNGDKVQPGDKITVDLTTDYPSGTTFTYDKISIKVLCSKIHNV